jgi:hypothetical protein
MLIRIPGQMTPLLRIGHGLLLDVYLGLSIWDCLLCFNYILFSG